MENISLALTGLGFWLAVAVIASVYMWSRTKKQQMKHELTLKLLDKGQDVNQDLLVKLLSSDKPGMQQKSIIDQNRDAGGSGGFIFLIMGLTFAFFGIAIRGHTMQPVPGAAGPGQLPMMQMVESGPNWLLIGLGAFCFVFGVWILHNVTKEYKQAKAEEKQSRD